MSLMQLSCNYIAVGWPPGSVIDFRLLCAAIIIIKPVLWLHLIFTA